jgi:hypothetical protein
MQSIFSPKSIEQGEKGMSGEPSPPSDNDTSTHAQAPLGAGQQVQVSMTLPQFIRTVIVNVLVLAELFVAMYMATQEPEEFTPVFFRVFFSLLVPTLILAILSKRFLRPKAQQ